MELLEAATKILSSPTPSLGQTPGSAVGPRAACKSVGRKDSKDLPPSTQVRARSVGARKQFLSKQQPKEENVIEWLMGTVVVVP